MANNISESRSIDPDLPYSFEAIAAFFSDDDVDERRVRRWVSEGRMGYVQLPKGRRVLGRHLIAFLNKNSVEVE